MDDQTTAIQKRFETLFPATLGIRITSAAPDGVTAELDVRDELCTVPGICHGGALMAFAIHSAPLAPHEPPAGAGTTTLDRRRTSSACHRRHDITADVFE